MRSAGSGSGPGLLKQDVLALEAFVGGSVVEIEPILVERTGYSRTEA
jgi:hypothetical protein